MTRDDSYKQTGQLTHSSGPPRCGDFLQVWLAWGVGFGLASSGSVEGLSYCCGVSNWKMGAEVGRPDSYPRLEV